MTPAKEPTEVVGNPSTIMYSMYSLNSTAHSFLFEAESQSAGPVFIDFILISLKETKDQEEEAIAPKI